MIDSNRLISIAKPESAEQIASRDQTGRVYAVLPTFCRQSLLRQTLQQTAAQQRRPDVVVIVDNESSSETKKLVDEMASRLGGWDLRYLAAPDNLGSAGGWALGMQSIIDEADDDDWIMTLDDDDPPRDIADLARIHRFACEQRQSLPNLAGVGIVGARFDWKTGYLIRLSDEQLIDSTPVDYIGSNHMPLYSAAVMKKHGVFRGDLFFGHTEVEYCLRLRKEGLEFRCCGPMWRERREQDHRTGVTVKPSRLCNVNWRKYYVTRNYIRMMREHRRTDLALKRAFIQSLAKPLYTLPFSPRRAWQGFLLGTRASWDGFRGNMGRVIDPAKFKSQSADAKLRPTAE